MRSADGRRRKRRQRRPEMLLDLRRDVDRFARQDVCDPFRGPAALGGIVDQASGWSATEFDRVVGQRAAEIMPVAAHGERGGADRAAEVEGKDLDSADSGGTAAPSAPAAPTCRRRSDPPPAYGRHRRRGAKSGTASHPRSCRRTAAARRDARLASGPAQTADSGIMCARLSVETGGCRTLA